MRIITIFTFLIIFRLIYQGVAFAQDVGQFDPIKDDLGSKILPLEMLIDSAIANNPYIQFRDLQLIINDCKLRSNRIEWTRNFGIQTDVRYGNFYNYSANSAGGVDPPPVSTIRNEFKYGAAVYMNLPIFTFANRKNQIKLAETEVQQAQRMAEVQRSETRQVVIRQYNDLILKQRLLRIKAKYLETSRINMQMVEKEFANGIISVTEYARISETVTRTESDFESSRMDFLTAYMILEEVVGMKFNLTNDISGSHEGN
jgi:outer membrane protein TolC